MRSTKSRNGGEPDIYGPDALAVQQLVIHEEPVEEDIEAWWVHVVPPNQHAARRGMSTRQGHDANRE